MILRRVVSAFANLGSLVKRKPSPRNHQGGEVGDLRGLTHYEKRLKEQEDRLKKVLDENAALKKELDKCNLLLGGLKHIVSKVGLERPTKGLNFGRIGMSRKAYRLFRACMEASIEFAELLDVETVWISHNALDEETKFLLKHAD